MGSGCFSIVDLNHVFHKFGLDDESKYLFVFYSPKNTLRRFNCQVMGVSSDSSECHKRVKSIVDGLEGIQKTWKGGG